MELDLVIKRDITKPELTILKWLQECEDRGILPWEYDLKQEIYIIYKEEDHPVKRLLDSWVGDYYSQLYYKVGEKKAVDIETEQCTLMQCVYDVLWTVNTEHGFKYENGTFEYSTNQKENISADIMNSFWTPYKKALKSNQLLTWQKKYYQGNNQGAYQKNAGDFRELLDNFNRAGYREVNNQLKRFAELTHTIGNCTLVPVGFNGNIHKDCKNTWSTVLNEHIDLLNNFVDKNINSEDKYKEKFMMNMYKETTEYKYNDSDYLKKVTNDIESRGKLMIKNIFNKLKFLEVDDWQNLSEEDEKTVEIIKSEMKSWSFYNLLSNSNGFSS